MVSFNIVMGQMTKMSQQKGNPGINLSGFQQSIKMKTTLWWL